MRGTPWATVAALRRRALGRRLSVGGCDWCCSPVDRMPRLASDPVLGAWVTGAAANRGPDAPTAVRLSTSALIKTSLKTRYDLQVRGGRAAPRCFN